MYKVVIKLTGMDCYTNIDHDVPHVKISIPTNMSKCLQISHSALLHKCHLPRFYKAYHDGCISENCTTLITGKYLDCNKANQVDVHP